MTQKTTGDVASHCNSGVHITPMQQMVASSTGALLTSLLVTPLDVVKTRLQTQSKPLARGQHFYYCNGLMDHVCTCMNGNGGQYWYKKPGHFTGTMDAVVKIGRYEGIPALWSGLPPTLVMAVPATVVYFTLYEQLKAVINYRQYNGDDWWKPTVAGVTARTFAVTFISPLELVRTKMQSEQLSYVEVGRAIRCSIQQSGVRSLWRGLVPTLLRDVPFSALYWFCYERMKFHALCIRGSQDLTFLESFSSGAAAGSIAAIITLPFDVIKTHRQIELGVMKNGVVEISSTWRLIGRLYADRGIQALFTGLVPRVVKVAPACAIMISTYEYFKSFFWILNHVEPKSLAN